MLIALVKCGQCLRKNYLSGSLNNFLTEQTRDILIHFAAWMQKEGRTDNWKKNYAYFSLKYIHLPIPALPTLDNAGQSAPAQAYQMRAE